MSERESNSNCLICELQGSDAVTRASDVARAFGDTQGLDEDDLARFCIVLEELTANLYEHGGLTDRDKVGLSLTREPGAIRIIITDPGTPFDLRSAASNHQRPERGGGVGIDIIRSWARIVDYAVTPEGNRLELVLPI